MSIRPLVRDALQDDGNWATQLPPSERAVVTLRAQPAAADPLVHPLADLQVTQRVVPLGLVITRFGNTLPEGPRRFVLSLVGANTAETVSDFFAPAQFRDMSDEAKLAAPAFERLPAGLRLTARGYACGDPVVEPAVAYETKILYAAIPPGPTVAPPPYVASTGLVEQMAPVGAVGLAPRRLTGTARYRTEGPSPAFSLKAPAYAVAVSRDTTATPATPSLATAFATTAGAVAATAGALALSYMAATEALGQRLAAHPEERARLRVVPHLEGVAA